MGLKLGGGTAGGVKEEVLGGGVGEQEASRVVDKEKVEAYLRGAVFSFVARVAGLSADGKDAVERATVGFLCAVEGSRLTVGEDACGEGLLRGAVRREDAIGSDGEVFDFTCEVEDVSKQGLMVVHGFVLFGGG